MLPRDDVVPIFIHAKDLFLLKIQYECRLITHSCAENCRCSQSIMQTRSNTAAIVSINTHSSNNNNSLRQLIIAEAAGQEFYHLEIEGTKVTSVVG